VDGTFFGAINNPYEYGTVNHPYSSLNAALQDIALFSSDTPGTAFTIILEDGSTTPVVRGDWEGKSGYYKGLIPTSLFSAATNIASITI